MPSLSLEQAYRFEAQLPAIMCLGSRQQPVSTAADKVRRLLTTTQLIRFFLHPQTHAGSNCCRIDASTQYTCANVGHAEPVRAIVRVASREEGGLGRQTNFGLEDTRRRFKALSVDKASGAQSCRRCTEVPPGRPAKPRKAVTNANTSRQKDPFCKLH